MELSAVASAIKNLINDPVKFTDSSDRKIREIQANAVERQIRSDRLDPRGVIIRNHHRQLQRTLSSSKLA